MRDGLLFESCQPRATPPVAGIGPIRPAIVPDLVPLPKHPRNRL